jgi:hypothetical protein
MNILKAADAALFRVKEIHTTATSLSGISGSINAFELMNKTDQMRAAFFASCQPILDHVAQADANTAFETITVGHAPNDSFAQLQALRTALIAFYTAYRPVFQNLTFVTYTVAGGHVYADIPVASLSSLSDEIAAVIAAAAPLV